ncbi:hypoxanthine phosphoribosyltransferase [bacterium]|nr:hypoxanthine phosphoribosyltransferase [bacterium]|tara:strand:+ start:3397 stop:3903 length:507 start_codon:yes stop_codon:yes gene_type:complete
MKTLISKEEVEKIVSGLAREINQDYAEREVVLIGVLKGAVFFLADLALQINIPLQIDFVEASSYKGTQSSGEVTFRKDISTHIAGRDVLIVEDIVDTGRTIREVKKRLEERGPSSLKVVTFLDKPSQREVDVKIDYVGREIEDVFVVGYGMDYEGEYRNLGEVKIFEE